MLDRLSKIRDLNGLINYFAEVLHWNIDLSYFDDIEDVTYEFNAEDLGLKEEAFSKISSLRQLPPLVDNQPLGIFCIDFESKKFESTALRKILSVLIPKKRNSVDHMVWNQQDLLFLCFWGESDNRTIGIAHFKEREHGLSQIRIISCAPGVEDITQLKVFEERLSNLVWPEDIKEVDVWRDKWTAAFTTGYRETINTSSELAKQLAKEAHLIRDRILSVLDVESKNGYVHLLYYKFKDTLVHDMTEKEFADMYAQTVVYGLFSARCMDNTQEDFSALEAIECIPLTNPFLKELMKECLSSNMRGSLSFDELEISSVIEILQDTRTDVIIKDFNRQTGGGKEDPVIHFYEDFLDEYDKNQKVKRGVYYTPQPVVNFIIRAINDILKNDFRIDGGIASTNTRTIKYMRQSKKRIDGYLRMVEDEMEIPAIQILDPATGTGTFLRQAVLQIYNEFCEVRRGMQKSQIQNEWNEYVPKHLLPRINGFELMMAPYAVAHMKLAMVLKDTGYRFDTKERLKVYLTNALEKPGNAEEQIMLFEDPLAFESVSANVAKNNLGINVVIGNPPYSGISANNNEWIAELVNEYKYTDGVYFNERKHWLNDDYVKFIRMAQWYLSKSSEGIMAYICPHGYIDNPTFRAMRWNLLKEYNEIYILNLHGNINRKEKCPDGSKDENVFDIQQGVSINFFLKKKLKQEECKVYYADLYGSREYKYYQLNDISFNDIEWEEIIPNEPYYLFKPSDVTKSDGYETGFKLTDLFYEYTAGVITARDGLAIDFNVDSLITKIKSFADPSYSDDDVRSLFWPGKKTGKYLPGDSRGWSVSDARKKIVNNNHAEEIRKIIYRPFDFRYIYYSSDVIDWGRDKILSNLHDDNIALISARSNKSGRCDHFYITNELAEAKCGESTTQSTVFPLYINKLDDPYAKPNLREMLANDIAKKVDLGYNNEKKTIGITENEIGPYDLIYYIYSIMYSNKYRDKYHEKIVMDFPTIPMPTDRKKLDVLIKLGYQLKKLHLMEFDNYIDTEYNFSENQSMIEKYKYDNGRVYINADAYFNNIEKADWEFYIGGYQPLQKWLKDRKGRHLTEEDIVHYEKMIWGIKHTILIMNKIDEILVI